MFRITAMKRYCFKRDSLDCTNCMLDDNFYFYSSAAYSYLRNCSISSLPTGLSLLPSPLVRAFPTSAFFTFYMLLKYFLISSAIFTKNAFVSSKAFDSIIDFIIVDFTKFTCISALNLTLSTLITKNYFPPQTPQSSSASH